MQPDIRAFFENYIAACNRSLSASVDSTAIRSSFAESFIGANPQGVVCGDNDEAFTETLLKGYAFYKSIGTRKMALEDVETAKIDPSHFLVTVSYRATYDRNGKAITIPFSVAYLLQHRDGQLKIFGFIAGDEMEIYRHHGLLPT